MSSKDRQQLYPNLRKGGGTPKKQSAGKAAIKGHPNLRRGGPGRKKGIPNRVTREAKAFAEGILHDPVVQARMAEDARRGRLPPPVVTLLMSYAWGKPKERVELEVMEALVLKITDDLGEDVEPQAPRTDDDDSVT